MNRLRTTLVTVAALAVLFGAHPLRAGTGLCAGDCDGDQMVSVAELVTMITIALGERDLLDCKSGDGDDDGAIEVDDLIRAVDNALNGCRGAAPFKTSIDHPSEPYLAYSSTFDGPSWVKFTIRVDDPTVVYFQNSSLIPFHQDFVSTTLPPYIGWTAAEIDAVSLHEEGQELVFGAVLYSPFMPSEIAIQLVRQDPYSAADVIKYFEAVRASVRAAAEVPFFYFPTFEQQQAAADYRQELENAGIRIGSTARWSQGDDCYAFGWAHGRLVFVEGDEITDAYAAGDLGPNDILLTDGVPAEIPFVAGVVSLAPSTPSSHVAILAADWEIPFAFLSRPESIELAQSLIGRDVVLRATTLTPNIFTGTYTDFTECQVRLVDVTDALSGDVTNHLRDLKQAPDLQLRAFVLSGSYSAEVDTATPDDIVTIGGKAANYGLILRAVPQTTREAMAFTFDLWNDYLDQTLEGGVTLRARIAELLAPFPAYPPSDFGALYDALDEVRDLIDDVADFNPAQRTAIIAALQRFDKAQPIRFRSSTNVEDSDVFTGAGLYESESGCLTDDTDNDNEGPSRCDAARPGERGVFRALRKVFQSFYNDNAFLERLRHRVDETKVGMAVLVHYTFVDADELANGVATLHVTSPSNGFATVVMQPGAIEVTNAGDDGLPEVVDIYISTFGTYPTLRQSTERLPLGATILEMPNEYIALTNLLLAVGDAFGEFHGETAYDIEFEFKKTVQEGLVLRQVRRIPAITSGNTPPVLIDAPTELCTFQGEYGDIFGNYRLKSRWLIDLASGPVVGDDAEIYAAAGHSYLLNGAMAQLTGKPSTWPGARHETFDPEIEGLLGFRDSWTVGSGASRRVMSLSTLVPAAIGPNHLPIVFADDLGFTLNALYDTGVPYLDFEREVQQRPEEQVLLVGCSDVRPLTGEHLLQDRNVSRKEVDVNIGFYWPPPPTGAVAGYTAPVDRWTATTITGIGTTPAQLQGFFSQTYRPQHHNFDEGFIFDPHLEPGIDPAILQQWDAADIAALVVPSISYDPSLMALTLDGQLVPLD